MKKKALVSLVLLTMVGTSLVFAQKTTFKGHQYQLFEDSKSWTEAKAHCESLGGYLVAINSELEQAFIEGFIARGQKNFYWIGGYCDADRVFRWVTGEPFSYKNWASRQPDNGRGKEDKLSIYRLVNPKAPNSPGQWNDLANDGIFPGEAFFSGKTSGYICEWNK